MKTLACLFGTVLALVLGVAVLASGPDAGSAPSALALDEIPADLLRVYVDAAATCDGLPWQVLAAIGYSESRHAQGHADPATGDVNPPIVGPALNGTHGNASIRDPSSPDGWAHALGPMQFLPSTWERWGRLAPGRPAGATRSPQNAWDAIYSAAAYLCGGRHAIDDLGHALLTYNHSSQYVQDVMAKAAEYGLGSETNGDVAIVAGMACPVAGPVSFSDDFGAPRSGGRTHKGNDLFANRGTPVVAIENGVIDRTSDVERGLGGITVWLRGDSGTTYYYAHHSANVAHAGQRVAAGEVIAYVGNTGNARGGPTHVHFEIHPGGDEAIDPYTTVSRVCASNRK